MNASVKRLLGLLEIRRMLRMYLKIAIPAIRCIVRPSNVNRRLMSTKFYKTPTKNEDKIGTLGYFLLLIPGTTFCLGTWQVKRRKWKINLIEKLKENSSAPPIELPENLEGIEKLEYRRVKIRGFFLHEQEMYVRPRSLLTPEGGEKQSSGLMSTSQTGAHVVTPFKLSDREDTILVNRGWVPRNKITPTTRPASLVSEEVEIMGIIRKTEPRLPLGPKQVESEGNVFWMFRDVSKMARARNCSPVFVDACIVPNRPIVEGEPIAGQTKITLRNEHLSYILTWYSLSAATGFIWFRRFVLGKVLM